MKKLLLVVLTWLVLAGTSRAQDAPAEEAGPGMVTLVVEKAQAVAYRLAGRVLGSLIAKGMSKEQVTSILSEPDNCAGGRIFRYTNLEITVCFGVGRNAAGDRYEAVFAVFFPD